MPTSDFIQIVIATITLFAVLVALFGQRFWKWKDKPQIGINFDEENSEFYHLTDMHIIQNGAIIALIPTYYIRLKITNLGKTTLENAEVILEKVAPQQERFMSLNLSWAGFIAPPNDITRTARIPPGQSRVVDIIEVMEPKPTSEIADYLKKLKDTDAERYSAYGKGFRCCSIKPNSLSDIFPINNYMFNLGVYADNVYPKNFRLSAKYDGKWDKNIKSMRSSHLKIKLLS
ncbi:hypothetical protein HY358_00445 [Candidatus Roizmanbacteria bacterium]|nr:hypothetical protein [Candidatus Roizmanbacteria bacterium]